MSTNESYDLEVLLDLRKQEKDRAEDAYGEALNALERERRKVVEAQGAIERAIHTRRARCQAFDEDVTRGGSMVALQRFDDYLVGLKAKEEELHEHRQKAEALAQRQEREVQTKKADLIEATKALMAVEKHHEAWLEEQAVLGRRKESERLDDIAARIWRENHG